MRRLADHSFKPALFLAAVLTLALAACAPATGGQSSAAVRAGDQPIRVQRGQTVFVRIDYTLDEFGVKEEDLRSAMWVPSGYASETGDVTVYFSLHDVQGASGWQIDLSRFRLKRSTVTNTSFDTTSVVRETWAEIRVMVPEDAIGGVYRVRGSIEARGGKSRPLAFRIEVP